MKETPLGRLGCFYSLDTTLSRKPESGIGQEGIFRVWNARLGDWLLFASSAKRCLSPKSRLPGMPRMVGPG